MILKIDAAHQFVYHKDMALILILVCSYFRNASLPKTAPNSKLYAALGPGPAFPRQLHS